MFLHNNWLQTTSLKPTYPIVAVSVGGVTADGRRAVAIPGGVLDHVLLRSRTGESIRTLARRRLQIFLEKEEEEDG